MRAPVRRGVVAFATALAILAIVWPADARDRPVVCGEAGEAARPPTPASAIDRVAEFLGRWRVELSPDVPLEEPVDRSDRGYLIAIRFAPPDAKPTRSAAECDRSEPAAEVTEEAWDRSRVSERS